MNTVMLRNILTLLFALILTGCATTFEGENKVVRVAPHFITIQVQYGSRLSENWAWAHSLAKQHCAKSSRIPFAAPDIDNSWHKEGTYFCVKEEDQANLVIQFNNVGNDNFFANMRRTYGGVSSQIERIGAVVVLLSDAIVPSQTSAPNTIQPIQTICIKSGESITGMFKTCRYSCMGSPA